MNTHRLTRLGVGAYALLLVYGTWFPIAYWDWGLGGLEAFLAMDWPTRISKPDLIINLIVYVPLGLGISLIPARRSIAVIGAATLAGLALSCFLEYGQTFLPGRVTSASDIVLNTVGSLVGALIGNFVARSLWLKERLQRIVKELRHPGVGRLGLVVLALWVVSQWTPFVPSLDLSNLKQGLAPFQNLAGGSHSYFIAGYIQYSAMLAGLLAIALRLFKDRERATPPLLAALFLVLAGKVLIMTRQLSPEALLAAGTVSLLALWMRRLNSQLLQALALLLLVIYQLFETFTPSGADPTLRTMNWIPFRGQMNSLTGIVDLVNGLWLFAAYAYLLYPRARRSTDGLALRLCLIAPWALVLEWGQQMVPGRYPDITDVFVGVGTFILTYSYPWRRKNPARPGPHRGLIPRTRWHRALGLVMGVLGIAFLVSRLAATSDDKPYALPSSAELPNPQLPHFEYEHPRLPAPTPNEWALLTAQNPAFVERHRQKARGKSFYSRTLMARTEPGSVDLDRLFNDLLDLKFTWRGHEQTLPIAIAYDWLYDQWTPVQRGRLLSKAEQACAFQEAVIRDRLKLSPYNVYLYNSPLQALLAVSLAIHGDASSGDCMRFTYDYWKHRVLPVWRQVMGLRGGWHEGGEYVGIGIGQAIHRLPAMWRSATQEDVFVSHTGIRGFLDFVLHRTRPDGTSMRLGDIAFVKNNVPDFAPLALEFAHRAAYTRARAPVKPTPLGYPWGPISNPALFDETAIEELPRARWFDGIGVMTARSDWSPDATYVTFKAGNNYWSHMHLDQGAFTIFNGSGLAIDSGVYFDYGGEHHMNYTYQTVAHNVVTVTDPEDTALLPGKERTDKDGKKTRKPDRAIANDGGQRRVGSGWGKAAPLDLTDWKQQRATYQTVGDVLVDSDLRDDFVWVNADLTPAYTNEHSRKGEFFARTRRIERYLRSWVYLADRDLILIHDRLTLSKGGLRPRWLLHSQHEPGISESSFVVTGEFADLRGRVMLPLDANLQSVGGPGFEFFIDSKNYDQDGKALKSAAKRKGLEPGAWRVEVAPSLEQRHLEFFVALEVSRDGSSRALDGLQLQRTSQGVQLTGFEDGTSVTLPRRLDTIRIARETP